MPSRSNRKLIALGANLCLTLPKQWTDFWEMKKGETITILCNGILVAIPPTCPDRDKMERKARRVLNEF